jgi:hypothetical protein
MAESSESQQPPEGEDQTTKQKQNTFFFRVRTGFFRLVRCLEKFNGLITALATVLLAIITALLSLIAYWQYTDPTLRETLVAANRAWVSPLSITFDGEIKAGSPLTLWISYENKGKEPAINTVFFREIDAIPVSRLATPEMLERWKSGLTASQELMRELGLAIDEKIPKAGCEADDPRGIAMGATHPGVLYPVPYVVPTKFINPDFENGLSLLVVKGCFAYKTFKSVHHSWYCFFYSPQIEWCRCSTLQRMPYRQRCRLKLRVAFSWRPHRDASPFLFVTRSRVGAPLRNLCALTVATAARF